MRFSRVLQTLIRNIAQVFKSPFRIFSEGDADKNLDNCKVLGVLKTDLSTIPRWKFDKVTGQNGEDCYKIDYTLLATFYDADIKVEFRMKSE
jgi:hypothetical protein